MKLLRILVLALALAVAGGAPAAQPDPSSDVPTAADLAAQPFFQAPVLSPDGKHIAGVATSNGQRVVTIVDVSKPELTMKIYKVGETAEVGWLRWANNDRLLVSIVGWARSLRLIDLGTGKLLTLSQPLLGIEGDDVIFVDPEGAYLLLAFHPFPPGPPRVDRVDLATGAFTTVVPKMANVWRWFADRAGVVRAGMGIEGKRWWLVYRDADGAPFARTARHRFTSDKEDEDDDVESLIPVAGSDLGYAVAMGASGRLALYRYDFKAGALGELVYENPAVDVDELAIDPGGTVVGVRYEDDRPETLWFDPELKQLQARLDKALPGAVNKLISFSRDKSRVLIWSGSATDPGLYLLFDRNTKQLRRLAASYDELVGKRLAPMEPVRYQARDGLEIHGYLTLPLGRGDKKLPLVVMPHGGPFARDSWGYDAWVQYLASKGYAVLQPNYRGSTGFGRAYVERGNGQWGRGMQDDVDDGVKWLAERGTIDARRVCIMGASYGGYAAEWAAVRNPELYRCAISFAGVSDIEAQLRYSRYYFAAPRYFRDWRTRIQGGSAFELDAISPLKQAERVSVPLLIGHGANDSTVPVMQSQKLAARLTKLGKPHEYVEYKGEGHGFADPKNAADFLNRVGAFLDKYNPS